VVEGDSNAYGEYKQKISLNINPTNASVDIESITWSTNAELEFTGDEFERIYTIPANSGSSDKTYTITVSIEDIFGIQKSATVELTAVHDPANEGTGDQCLLPNTLINMADGTRKPVESIETGDEVLVFNHETGEYDTSIVLFNDYEPKKDYLVVNLEFSNGKQIGVIYEHGFFDMTTMEYVYIDANNYHEYIGHEFFGIDGEQYKLVNAYTTIECVEVYCPVTLEHMNFFTEDLLSMPGGILGLLNIFEYDENLKYNEELKKKDIEKYGLYSYEDFKPYCSYEFYSGFPTKYFKVAVGKGYVTFDYLIYLIERYESKM